MSADERGEIVRALVTVALGVCNEIAALELVAMLLSDASSVLDDPGDPILPEGGRVFPSRRSPLLPH